MKLREILVGTVDMCFVRNALVTDLQYPLRVDSQRILIFNIFIWINKKN